MVDFQILVFDSLKLNSKTESQIIRFAKAVISRNILPVETLIYFFCIFSFLFVENRHYHLICIMIATDVIGWPEYIKRYIYLHL